MMEAENNIVTLIDENGKEVEFDLVMTFEYEGDRYAALLPIDKVENVGDDEVVLLRIDTEDGEEKYSTIENPILLDEVFSEFLDLFDQMLDEEDEEIGS